MWKQGADVAKIATTATDISDCARVLTLLKSSEGIFVHKTHTLRHELAQRSAFRSAQLVIALIVQQKASHDAMLQHF